MRHAVHALTLPADYVVPIGAGEMGEFIPIHRPS